VDIIRDIGQMHRQSEAIRRDGKRIGCVPTMGYLHQGHLSLVRRAREVSQVVVVSLFVNPTQFGPQEDYDSYPRDISRDISLLQKTGCDILFRPTVEQMYPPGHSTVVEVQGLTEVLCGASRPGHFRGVTTVVTMLFDIIRPHVAVFGQKDAQQAIVIRRMVADLHQGVEIVVAPTVREPDGLAMSSRNEYLTPQQRREAPILYQALQWAGDQIRTGERQAEHLIEGIRHRIETESSGQIDYISIVDTGRLRPISELSGEVLIALAVKFERARLIDNLIVRVGNRKSHANGETHSGTSASSSVKRRKGK
jgi:pantoate--beta-alanine ligase